MINGWGKYLLLINVFTIHDNYLPLIKLFTLNSHYLLLMGKFIVNNYYLPSINLKNIIQTY